MLKYSSRHYVRVLFFAALLLALSPRPSAAQAPEPFFYYYQGTRIPLSLNPARVSVRFQPGASESARRALTRQNEDAGSYDARQETGTLGLTLMPVRAGRDPLAAIQEFKQSPLVQSAGAVFQFADGAQWAESGEFIARFKSNVPPIAIALFNLANGVEVARVQPYSKHVLILRARPGNPRSTLALANTYVESHLVEFAEPNFAIFAPRPPTRPVQAAPRAPVTPNDPNFGKQWYLQNTGQFQGSTAGSDINALLAWGVTTGVPLDGNVIKIAIIDEGVDSTHPDLAGQVLTGINVTVSPPSTDSSPSNNDYHGTATAGIAAALTNNATGIAGVCWNCKILPVKVAYERTDGSWNTTTAQLAQGIDWAWQNGADVLSNSWTMSAPSDDVTLAIVDAYTGGRNNFGSTVVFSTGNSDVNLVSFPANLNRYVIAVGASNWCDGRKAKGTDGCNADVLWGSNYGVALDLLAPGQQIYTTFNSGFYNYLSGTSASTPVVAGVIGLLYSLNPTLTPQQVQIALQNGAKDIPPPGKDIQSGYGRVDAYGAIKALYNLSVSMTQSDTLVKVGDTVQYTLTYANTGVTDMDSTLLKVTLPAGLTCLNSCPGFTPLGGGVYQLNLGTLPAGLQATVALSAQPQPGTEGQTLNVLAQIGGKYPELNTSDNSAAAALAVALPPGTFLPLLLR